MARFFISNFCSPIYLLLSFSPSKFIRIHISYVPVLFLDEPTTGLDASTSFTLTTLLDELARENSMTVIMSIHQPRASIFKQIERLTLLSQGQQLSPIVFFFNSFFQLPNVEPLSPSLI